MLMGAAHDALRASNARVSLKEDDENYLNAVDYMFKGLEKRKPDCFAVKQYRKYKLSSGDVCSK